MRLTISAALLASLALATTLASAQQPGGGPMMGRGGPGMMAPGEEARERMDRVNRGRGERREGRRGGGAAGPHHAMGMRLMWILIDTDGNGTLSLEEVQAAHARIFAAVDSDGDGEVSPEEVSGFLMSRAPFGAGPGPGAGVPAVPAPTTPEPPSQ